jgi:RHS repeat-associated protein
LINGNWVSSFYGLDGHGSVRFLTDTTGAITDTYTFDAFGNLIASTGSTPNNYLYAGEQLDPSLGFYYLRARYMNPSSGRFWTLDTYEGSRYDSASLHKYLYASANPNNNTDPSGKSVIGVVIAAALILVGGAIFARGVVAPVQDRIDNAQYLANAELDNAESDLYWHFVNLLAAVDSLLLSTRIFGVPRGVL